MTTRGRKRKGGKREPNGRAARPAVAERADDAMRTALEYRQRVFGISAMDLRDQKAATLLGRLCLSGAVSEAQWQAGENWLRLVNSVYAAVNAPRGFRTAGSSALALDEDAEIERYQLLKTRFDAANTAVEEHAPVVEKIARMRVLTSVVVNEVDNPSQHGTLRMALNGLVRYFRTEARGA